MVNVGRQFEAKKENVDPVLHCSFGIGALDFPPGQNQAWFTNCLVTPCLLTSFHEDGILAMRQNSIVQLGNVTFCEPRS
jgi:hypothetical protein